MVEWRGARVLEVVRGPQDCLGSIPSSPVQTLGLKLHSKPMQMHRSNSAPLYKSMTWEIYLISVLFSLSDSRIGAKLGTISKYSRNIDLNSLFLSICNIAYRVA